MIDVIPSASDRIEAEREVESLEQDGATFWRAAGAVQGQRSRFVDETLRDRLVEALAAIRAMEGGSAYDEVKDAIADARVGITDLSVDHDIGDDFDGKIDRVVGSDDKQFAERASDLIVALAQRVADLLSRSRSAASDDGQAPPSNVHVLRPGLRKGRPKTGETTLSLFPAEEVTVVDAPAEVVPGKAKRGRKRVAK